MRSEVAPHLRFRSTGGEHLFVSSYSRLFDLDQAEADAFDEGDRRAAMLAELGRRTPGDEDLGVPSAPDPQSISLNVSASCNLACSYCYASRGNFEGRQSTEMDWAVAKRAIDKLLDEADASRPITIGFMGGEPLVGRTLIEQVVAYSAMRGARERLDVRYSITTNGTLIRPSDIALFRSHGFAVTISLDGSRQAHDRQRPQAGGRGSLDLVSARIAPLLADPGAAHVAARATVTAVSEPLDQLFGSLVELGFAEIGLSPLRGGSTAALSGEHWQRYADELIALARSEVARIRAGKTLRLTNLAVALKQIHRGACSPYPCGAGGGYFSVASDGAWYACHRAIGDDRYRMGSNDGLDAVKRSTFLAARHVDSQTDCQTCWARYLCSGGCHQETAARSADSCDFVRRWLHFCLESYCELSAFHHRLTQWEGLHA